MSKQAYIIHVDSKDTGSLIAILGYEAIVKSIEYM